MYDGTLASRQFAKITGYGIANPIFNLNWMPNLPSDIFNKFDKIVIWTAVGE
jgi:hypothetical protein